MVLTIWCLVCKLLNVFDASKIIRGSLAFCSMVLLVHVVSGVLVADENQQRNAGGNGGEFLRSTVQEGRIDTIAFAWQKSGFVFSHWKPRSMPVAKSLTPPNAFPRLSDTLFKS